LRPKEVTRCG